jgi:hypothetical protein
MITSTRTTDAENHTIKNTMDIKNADPNVALKSKVFVSNVKSKVNLFPSMEQGNHIFKTFSGIPDTKIKRTEAHIVVNGEAESQQRRLFDAIDIGSVKDVINGQITTLYKIKTGVKLDDNDLTPFEEYAKANPKNDKQPKKDDVAPPSLMDLLPDIYKLIPDDVVEKIMEPLVSNGFEEIYTKGDPTTYDNVRWTIVLKALFNADSEEKKRKEASTSSPSNNSQ